mmetsp:Transcript_85312/g.228118  ORF Transcript_85312/g.228118 Transcript_85312/m.228118 type:complete len:230 (-) Transcript_85312:404-1093(-)
MHVSLQSSELQLQPYRNLPRFDSLVLRPIPASLLAERVLTQVIHLRFKSRAPSGLPGRSCVGRLQVQLQNSHLLGQCVNLRLELLALSLRDRLAFLLHAPLLPEDQHSRLLLRKLGLLQLFLDPPLRLRSCCTAGPLQRHHPLQTPHSFSQRLFHSTLTRLRRQEPRTRVHPLCPRTPSHPRLHPRLTFCLCRQVPLPGPRDCGHPRLHQRLAFRSRRQQGHAGHGASG